jgi:aspartate dehydrogenase
MKKTVAIIGCGAIGSALAAHIRDNMGQYVSRMVLCDIDETRSGELARASTGAETVKDMYSAMDKADVVIEASSGSVVPGLLKAAIEKSKDIMIMSVGGLAGNEELLEDAAGEGIKVMLPTGAIAGIDAIKAARIAGIDSITLTTRKSPASLKGAPYLDEKGIDIGSVSEETVIFEGNALEAIKAFPKNVNVSVILSIAGIGLENTRVRIITSPEYTRNAHEISVESGAGRLYFRTENVPFPSNPGTSYLAALSAMATLEGYFTSVRAGT